MSMDYAKPRLGNCPNCDRLEADIYRLAEWEVAQLTWAAYSESYPAYTYVGTPGVYERMHDIELWGAWLAAEERRIWAKP